jgi:hypothetical protein
MKLTDKQTSIIAAKSPMEFQTLQAMPLSPLDQNQALQSTISSESSEETEEEEAFQEYIKGGEYDPATDAYFATFGLNRT